MERLCQDCEAIIAAKRLLAVPGARFCVMCQNHHDRRLRADWPVAMDEDEFNAASFVITDLPPMRGVVANDLATEQ